MDAQQTMDTKKSMREDMLEARKALSPDWIERTSKTIQQSALALASFKRPSVVACYLALPSEVQTEFFIDACWKDGRRICVPAYREDQRTFDWAWLEPGMDLETGPSGARQPTTPLWAYQVNPELITVPGVAFDNTGARLGRGGGHIDRLLHNQKGVKVGFAFEFQIFERVPVERHDQRVDVVLTEAYQHAHGKSF